VVRSIAARDHARVLHVTNGDAVVPRMRAAGVEDDIVPWRDVLHEGPIPAGLDVAGLRAERARFLAAYGAREEDVLAGLEARDERVAAAARDGEEVVLWFERDLYDQLQYLQVLAQLGAGPLPPVRLVELGYGNDPPASGLRPPSPASPRAIDRGVALTAADHAVARDAWAAVRSPDPTDLGTVTADGPLGAAIDRLEQHYPWATDGLTRSERALLAAVADGAHSREDAFVEAQRQEEEPFLGDATAFDYLDRMRGGPEPLLAPDELALTPRGAAVLAGAATWTGRPAMWIGGARLDAGESAWRYDPECGEVVGAGS